MTDDISTSGPLSGAFLTADEAQTYYEPMVSRGFNQLAKAKRQGRWFLLKGLKSECRHQPVFKARVGIRTLDELKAVLTERLKEVDLDQKKRDFVHLLFNEANAERIMQFPEVVTTI